MFKREDIEIMAPAGSFASLVAAIQAGADAVYFGAGELNMRAASSANFGVDDLKEIVRICGEHKVKSYLTLNTIIYDEDIKRMHEMVDFAADNNISAIIASDWAVIEYARSKNVNIHCSTQLNISNSKALQHYATYSEVAVLARELNLTQVRKIYDNIQENNTLTPSKKLMRIEMFIHGALCMAVSGKCYLSLGLHNKSANRGECLQPCRRGYDVYLVTEEEGKEQLQIENKYIMSPKDLCTIGFLDKIIDAGARVLKIEGRGRSPEYVRRVVECYNEALELIISDNYTDAKISYLKEKLQQVFNRGFWNGYYLGQTLGEWSDRHSSSATERKEFVGIGTNYFSRINVGEFLIQTGNLKIGDKIIVIGPTTGVIESTITEMHGDNGSIAVADKGMKIAIPLEAKIRRNDKLFKVVANEI